MKKQMPDEMVSMVLSHAADYYFGPFAHMSASPWRRVRDAFESNELASEFICDVGFVEGIDGLALALTSDNRG